MSHGVKMRKDKCGNGTMKASLLTDFCVVFLRTTCSTIHQFFPLSSPLRLALPLGNLVLLKSGSIAQHFFYSTEDRKDTFPLILCLCTMFITQPSKPSSAELVIN